MNRRCALSSPAPVAASVSNSSAVTWKKAIRSRPPPVEPIPRGSPRSGRPRANGYASMTATSPAKRDVGALAAAMDGAADGHLDQQRRGAHPLPRARTHRTRRGVAHHGRQRCRPAAGHQHALPHLRRAQGARVVHISSDLGSIAGNASGGDYAYRMSKAALNMACRSMAHNLRGSGIAVVAISPGWVRTDMGGSAAPLAVEESVYRMMGLIARLTPAQSGSSSTIEDRSCSGSRGRPWARSPKAPRPVL